MDSHKHDRPTPPRFAGRLLGALLPESDAEALAGDFAEEFELLAIERGRISALGWYWSQLLLSLPVFVHLGISSRLKLLGSIFREPQRAIVLLDRRNWIMETHRKKNTRLFLIGLILVLPAMLIVIPGLLQSGLSSLALNDAIDAAFARLPVLELLIHPIVILGGLLVAFLLNAWQVIDVHLDREPGRVVGRLGVNLYPLHLGMVLFSLGIVGIIFLYLLAENFQIFANLGFL
jgi:hypothetical protein